MGAVRAALTHTSSDPGSQDLGGRGLTSSSGPDSPSPLSLAGGVPAMLVPLCLHPPGAPGLPTWGHGRALLLWKVR